MIITHYFRTQEDALFRAKQVAKQPGYDFWGVTMPNGKRGFAIYKKGNLVEQYITVRKKD